MRVMQLDVNFGASSTGKIVRDLRDGLVQSGAEVLALYGRGSVSKEPDAIRIANPAEVLLHAGLTRVTGWTGGFSPLATRRFKQAVEEFQPDVVHLHELHGYYINIEEALQFLHERAVPIVWTFHCEFMYTGKCGHAHECERWRTGCHSCPQLAEYPASLMFDRTAQMYERKRQTLHSLTSLRLVTPSAWLASRVSASFLRDCQVDVVYNGIDTETVFRPRDRAAARARLRIETGKVVSSIAPDLMSPRKGGHWVLELARRMRDQAITFVLVGVEDSFSCDLPNVIAMSRTSDQDLLAEIYSASDAFLLTSEKETFSLVAAESLACGTPVVGFDCGAPLEVAPQGYGSWVAYGDIDALQQRLSGVLTGSVVMRGRPECRLFAKERYSRTGMVERYNKIYEELTQ